MTVTIEPGYLLECPHHRYYSRFYDDRRFKFKAGFLFIPDSASLPDWDPTRWGSRTWLPKPNAMDEKNKRAWFYVRSRTPIQLAIEQFQRDYPDFTVTYFSGSQLTALEAALRAAGLLY